MGRNQSEPAGDTGFERFLASKAVQDWLPVSELRRTYANQGVQQKGSMLKHGRDYQLESPSKRA